MAHNIKSGLVAFVEAVRTYFTAEGIAAQVAVLGWREYRKLPAVAPPAGAVTRRVVFLPSDESGKGGRFIGTRNVGRNPRAVATVERDLVVSIWAVDGSTPAALASDVAQIEAVEDLWESTVQAVRTVAHADALWGAFTWTLAPLEHAYGRELRVELRYRGPLLWSPPNKVTPGVGAITRTNEE